MTRARAVLAMAITVVLAAGFLQSATASGLERDPAQQTGQWEMGIRACSIMSVAGQTAYGWACFKPDGDLMRVHDNRSDGHMVGMKWGAGTRSGLCFHRGARGPGVESEYFVTGTHQCNKNLPEGATIRFRVGRCNVNTRNCSKLTNWKNWGPRRTIAVGQG